MYSKPPALKSPSIRQPAQTNVTKQKNKLPPTKTIPKPNTSRTTSITKPLQLATSINTSNVISSETQINTDNSKQSFASTVANSLIPKKDQAIIIDINDNLPHKDYIIAIGKLVQPSNILFASRISKGRICIFLSNKTLVDNLIVNHPIITIQEQHFKLRKLFNPNKRIILSNVYPNIPPDIIANEFVKLNIPLCNPITFLRAGIQVEEFTHILSFRRQTYILHEDLKKLPSSILINYDETNYRIFLSDDSLTCYLCKSQGHIASQCSNLNDSHSPISEENNVQTSSNTASKLDDNLNTNISPTSASPSPDTEVSISEVSNTLSTPTSPTNIPATTSTTTKLAIQTVDTMLNSDYIQMDIDQPSGTKRSLPDSFNTQSAPPSPTETYQDANEMYAPPNQDPPLNEKTEKTKKKSKRTKSASLTKFLENIDEYLKPAEQYFTDQNNSKIDFITFKHILENNQGPFEPPTIYNDYKISKEELLDIIAKIKPSLQHNSIKNRLTRFTKILKAEIYDSNESEA